MSRQYHSVRGSQKSPHRVSKFPLAKGNTNPTTQTPPTGSVPRATTPSDHETKEFKELDALIGEKLGESTTTFNWLADESELRKFAKSNFKIDNEGVRQIRITKNNFTHIYSKWREDVMPTIEIPDWSIAKKNGIIDARYIMGVLTICSSLCKQNLSCGKIKVATCDILHCRR